MQKLLHYIAQGLLYIREVTVPKGNKTYLLDWDTTDFWDPERPLKFYVVKKAVSQPSVFELRINWDPLYFRALFFVDDINDKQYKFLARSLLKDEPNPPELQQKINETEMVSIMYKSNPFKYLKEWSKNV